MRPMRTLTTAAAFMLLLLVLALAGCGSTRPNQDLPSEPQARAKVLGERLALRDPRTGMEGGESYLELTLTNPSDARIACRCAPEWYDAKGQPIAAPAAWRAVDLKAGAEARLRFAPMPATARSWRLQFEG